MYILEWVGNNLHVRGGGFPCAGERLPSVGMAAEKCRASSDMEMLPDAVSLRRTWGGTAGRKEGPFPPWAAMECTCAHLIKLGEVETVKVNVNTEAEAALGWNCLF